MSNTVNDVWLEQMWDEHKTEYLAWCDSFNWQADGADFWVWLSEKGLIPDEL